MSGDHGMQTIRYNIIERVLDVPLHNARYPGYLIGGYKTNHATWVAEHAVVYQPSLEALRTGTPLVRINSACFTGDIFGDRRCDCTEQLFAAMDQLKQGPGLIIYHLHHEGRGLGFTSKLQTYQRMEAEGMTTFEAAADIANRNDLRTYGSAVLILHDLGIKRLRLMTNNPGKRFVLEKNGFDVVGTKGLISTRPEIRSYLQSKKEQQGHSIEFDMLSVEENLASSSKK